MSAESTTRARKAADLDAPKLRWLRADAYHARSECGHFTVARRSVNGVDWYIAYRAPTESERAVSLEHLPSTELGATQVRPNATDAERLAAINAMKQLCEAAAAA
jgi:hypothetical protein